MWVPIYKEVLNARKLDTTIIIDSTYKETDAVDYEMVKHIELIWVKDSTIDLAKFTNLKSLFLNGVRDLNLINLPDSLELLALRYYYPNIVVPYKDTIKHVQGISSTMDYPYNFTKDYHSRRMDGYDFYNNYRFYAASLLSNALLSKTTKAVPRILF